MLEHLAVDCVEAVFNVEQDVDAFQSARKERRLFSICPLIGIREKRRTLCGSRGMCRIACPTLAFRGHRILEHPPGQAFLGPSQRDRN